MTTGTFDIATSLLARVNAIPGAPKATTGLHQTGRYFVTAGELYFDFVNDPGDCIAVIVCDDTIKPDKRQLFPVQPSEAWKDLILRLQATGFTKP